MKSVVLFASILLFGAKIFSQVSAPSIEAAFQNYLRVEGGSNLYRGSSLPTFLIKEDTRGNRYLFEKWVNGSVTGSDGVVYNFSKFSYNYDKVDGKLFMLMDSTTVMELSSKDIAGFTLKEEDREYHFERLKNSTDLNFYQPVYKDEKGFSLYKLLVTKLVKANYQTNGMIESGNKYDEYVDSEQYFIFSSKGELMKIEFKKKSIEKVLENESSKVEAFFNDHKNDKVDETFVTSLLQSLNSKSL